MGLGSERSFTLTDSSPGSGGHLAQQPGRASAGRRQVETGERGEADLYWR